MRYTTDGTLLLDRGVSIANADYEQTAQRLADALNAAASRDAEVARLRGALECIACDWSGIGTCPQCGLEHGGIGPRPTENLLRNIAREALNQEPHHAAD